MKKSVGTLFFACLFIAFMCVSINVQAENIENAGVGEYQLNTGETITILSDQTALYKISISLDGYDDYEHNIQYGNGGGYNGKGVRNIFLNISAGDVIPFTATFSNSDGVAIDGKYTISIEIFSDSGKCGDNVYYSFDNNGTLTITGSGDMYDYGKEKSTRPPWYGYTRYIKSVIFDVNITHIGNYSFYYEYGGNFTSLIFPKSIKTIGDYSFTFRCGSLSTLDFPEGLISIGKEAFRVTCMDNLVLPDSIRYVGEQAFYINEFKNIYLGNGIEYIGIQAFSENINLESVTIPSSLKTMDAAFSLCYNLKNINIAANGHFKSVDGIIYSKDGKQLVICPPALNKSGTVKIADGTEIICERAFDQCGNISELIIPEGVTTLGSAFASGCKLESIHIPSTINNLDYSAFFSSLRHYNWEIPYLYYNGTKEQWESLIEGTTDQTLYGESTLYSFAKSGVCGDNLTISLETESNIAVILDGKQIEFDVPPQLINDRTMVPMRAIFEALGATVEWNGDTSTVTAHKDDKTIILTIGEAKMYVNDTVVELDSPACIVEDRALVPVRAISESLELTVNWNGETNTVDICS